MPAYCVGKLFLSEQIIFISMVTRPRRWKDLNSCRELRKKKIIATHASDVPVAIVDHPNCDTDAGSIS